MAEAFSLDVDAFVDSALGRLDSLGAAVGESVLRRAAVAGARVFRDEAQALAPEQTGVLKRNIIIRHIEEESASDEMQVYFVTVRHGKFGKDGDAFYWRFVEFGHAKSMPRVAPVSIRSHREAMAAEFGSSRVAARPYMRPAFETRRSEAVDTMRARLAESVEEALKEFNK